MKILICLVSDQHLPNLITVHAVQPDLLVLVTTSEMRHKEAAPNLLKALAMGGLDYILKHEILELKDENSIRATYGKVKELYTRFPDAEWIANITGGTKPMSIGMYEFFREKGARVLYVPVSNGNIALDFSSGGWAYLDHLVTVGEFLAGYGFDILNKEDDIREKEERAKEWFELSVYLAASHEVKSIKGSLANMFRLALERDGRSRGLELGEYDGFYLLDEGLRERLARAFSLQMDGYILFGCLDKHQVAFLTGGWLEVFIWGMLSRYSEDLGIHEVRLGLNVGGRGRLAGRPENEWDIAFMLGQSLNMVECKTGDQRQDPSGNDTLYRVEAVKKQLGALKVNSYLATTSTNILEGGMPDAEIREHIRNRAELYRLQIITGKVIRKLALMESYADPNLPSKIAEAFGLQPG